MCQCVLDTIFGQKRRLGLCRLVFCKLLLPGCCWVLGETSISRKGKVPSSSVFCDELDARVLGIDILEELVAVFCLLDDKVSFTYMSHRQGVGAELMVLLWTLPWTAWKWGTNGGTHGCTTDLFKILTLEHEVCVLRQNSSRVMIWGMNIEVLFGSRDSCLSLCWTMVMMGSMGTEVKSALIS